MPEADGDASRIHNLWIPTPIRAKTSGRRSGPTSIYLAPLAETGPLYGALILIAGVGGGFAASSVADTVYGWYVHGIPPENPLDHFIKEIQGLNTN